MSRSEDEPLPWWRQPLFHFLLAGAAIFGLDVVRGSDEASVGRRIAVTQAHTERLADQWVLTFGRAPSEQELQGLVKNYIKEEIYYREALALGLDVNDPVVRQRLARKMEFVLSTELTSDDIDDSELRAYFDRNRDRYELSATYDFKQLFFKPLASGVTSPVEAVREQLNDGVAAQGLGDAIGLPGSMESADQAAVTRTFGSAFYRELESLSASDPATWRQRWAGPIESGFGVHLVFIERRLEARTPGLEDVRTQVVNDWLAEQNAVLKERAFDNLRSGYEIDIELNPQ